MLSSYFVYVRINNEARLLNQLRQRVTFLKTYTYKPFSRQVFILMFNDNEYDNIIMLYSILTTARPCYYYIISLPNGIYFRFIFTFNLIIIVIVAVRDSVSCFNIKNIDQAIRL